MSIQKHHMSHSAKIIGLAIITIVLALVLGSLLPKSSQAPEIVLTPESPIAPFPENFVLDNLHQNNRVNPGQIITGSVPGFWFFEASFPIELRDINGNVFGFAIAQTSEDWMTTNNVSFSATMPDDLSYTGVGSLVFTRDDPSDGESGIDMADFTAIVPVIFEE